MSKSKVGSAIRASRAVWRGATGVAALAMACTAMPSLAGAKLEIDDTHWVSIGAGIRTQYQSIEDGAPDGSDSNDFAVTNMRLYMSGQVHENIKFTFNTEKLDDESIEVLDAIVQLELSPEFNIWMGRMLTPADRIEMSGPFYALSWNQYSQPLYASDQADDDAGRIGRDEGVTLWGALGKFQYAIGAFDGLEGYSNQSDNLLFAGRFAYNFLNMESNPGYYTSSTYYGSLGNILTAAVSFQSQSDGVGSELEAGDFSGYTVDVLSETVFDGGGVLNIEAEYKEFDADYTLASGPSVADPMNVQENEKCFCLFDGDSYFVTAGYLFADEVGPGKFQPYVRYVENNPSDADSSDSAEFGLNYIISGHNARLNVNYVDGDTNASGYAGDDVGVLTFGVQLQI